MDLVFPDSRPAAGGGPPGLELRLLGPVQAARAGREVPLGGPKQRAVLALLLLDAGRVVPAGRLVEELWRGSAPSGAAKTLRSYVSRLRGLLEPDAALIARGGGYVISVGPGCLLDARRFEQLAAAGQAALGGGEPAAAAGRFREALALWRGQALADVCEVEPLALEAARLEELRLAALEGRAEADLALGLHGELAAELESLVAQYPLRERLWRLLVLALYRGERQADALAAYRRARAMLAADLGLEPGEELRRLEQQVLRQKVPAPPPPRQHNLLAPLTSFVGREQEQMALEELLGQARLITLTGAAGVGKTRLAVEAAARVVARFGHGVWLADLAGIPSPGLVAVRVMEALGVRQDGDVPVIEALRYRLRAADLLLVLDNCEHLLDACAELAADLLGSSPGLRVLATSREPLGVAGEITYPVPPLALPPDPADSATTAWAPAVRLFLDRASTARGGGRARAGGAPLQVAGRICRALDGLPLAIELAAARMSTLSAAEIETHLADRFAFLRHRRPVPDPRHQALQAAIDWSYDLLPADERRVFSELSAFAGDFALAQAAEMCSGGDQAAALAVIDPLASKSLLVAETAEDGTRYQMLDTIRQYAAGHLTEAGQSETTRRRHALTFLHLAEREHDLTALSRDHDNFRAALDWSLSRDDEAGPKLAYALGDFWLARGLLQEGRDWLERALAQRPADAHVRAGLLRLLGGVLYQSGDLQQAESVLSEGHRAAEAAGMAAVQARIRVLLAEIHNQQSYRAAEALAECEAAVTTLEAEGDVEGLAEAWLLAGKLRFFRDEWPADKEALERAIAYGRTSGNHRAEMQAGAWLVMTVGHLRVPTDIAISRAEKLLKSARNELRAEANLLTPLSLLYAYAGRFADARAALAHSLSIYTGFGATFELAEVAIVAGQIELIASDPVAAERHLGEVYEALRAMGERGYLSTVAGMLAGALYAQGRLDEAQRMTEEAEAATAPGDLDAQARWLTTRAKLLARRGQFSAARQLADEAQALISRTSWAALQAELLVAKAEVSRLAGALDEAAGSLRAALRIYQDRRAEPLAEQAKAALATLATQAGAAS
jgi:predicted ATPase/DNA-binding SARP family transcriptional activator